MYKPYSISFGSRFHPNHHRDQRPPRSHQYRPTQPLACGEDLWLASTDSESFTCAQPAKCESWVKRRDQVVAMTRTGRPEAAPATDIDARGPMTARLVAHENRRRYRAINWPIETTLHAFRGPPGDGGGPLATLTIGSGGVLYGTTAFGGSGTPCSSAALPSTGCGTVFQLTPPAAPGANWTDTVLYSFTGLDGDGAFPYGGVTVGSNGVLYGTTAYGGGGTNCQFNGTSGCGTVFELTPPTTPGGVWRETVLHSFTDQGGDGSVPVAGLIANASGILYGTTSMGGTPGQGTLFRIAP